MYELRRAIEELEGQALSDAQQISSTRIDRAREKARKAREKARKAWDWAHLADCNALHLADKAFHGALRAEAEAWYFEVEAEKASTPAPTFTHAVAELFAECGLPSNMAKLSLEIDIATKLADEMVSKIGKIDAAQKLRDKIHKTHEELDIDVDAIDWIIDRFQ